MGTYPTVCVCCIDCETFSTLLFIVYSHTQSVAKCVGLLTGGTKVDIRKTSSPPACKFPMYTLRSSYAQCYTTDCSPSSFISITPPPMHTLLPILISLTITFRSFVCQDALATAVIFASLLYMLTVFDISCPRSIRFAVISCIVVSPDLIHYKEQKKLTLYFPDLPLPNG